MANDDLSKYINYGEFYGRFIDDPRYKPNKKQQAVRCPFLDHDDTEASFSLNLDTGKWNCFGCGRSGNVVTFVSNMRGCSTKDAYKWLCDEYHIEGSAPKRNTEELTPLTIDQYSKDKHIPAAWLKANFMLKDTTLGNVAAIQMPYLNTDGHLFRSRIRAGHKAMRWGRKGAAFEDGATPLYGENLLDGDEGAVVLVEGESDTQALRYMGIDAVGCAGASMFNANNAEVLRGYDVVVHHDGDRGGDVFLDKVSEAIGGTVRVFKCRDIDAECKDPSDLLIKYDKDTAAVKIANAIEEAGRYERPANDGAADAEATPLNVEALPVGYIMTERGVFRDGEQGPRRVTATPMKLKSIVHDIVTGVEKVEVVWKRRGKADSAVFDRDVVMNARKVVDAMAPRGCNVSSGNAKDVVAYLTAYDAECGDALPVAESTPRLGWVDEARFVPYHCGDMRLDMDGGVAQRAEAVKGRGDLAGWKAVIGENRCNVAFRFILAAAFASPLVRLVDGRPMFLNIWGSSRFGKSAALKAALSVWGDPNKMMTTFQSTLNALCGIAELMCDLPVGIDERQSVPGLTMAQKQKNVEEIVYTLSGGHRKDRGTVNGGLQDTGSWHGLFLTTGEEPILKNNTMTGVASRTLELNERPFIDEASARAMHDGVARHFGSAGPLYLDAVMKLGWQGVRDLHARMVKDINSDSIYSDTAALIAVADYLASREIWDEDEWSVSVSMASTILGMLKGAEEVDVNRAAVEYLVDWIHVHKSDFDNQFGPSIGTYDMNRWYLYPSVVDKALYDGGFDSRKTLKHMADEDLIECEAEGSKRRYKKRRDGKRMIFLKINAINEYVDNVEGVGIGHE